MRLSGLLPAAIGLWLTAAPLLAQASGAPSAPENPEVRARRVLLGRVRLESLRYQRELPDFICTQLTIRFADHSGSGSNWKRLDTLQVEDTYVGRSVSHRLLMENGKPASTDYRGLQGFLAETVLHSVGFLPAWLFSPQSNTSFEWLRETQIDGRKMEVFSVRLPAADSKFTIAAHRQNLIAGIDGTIYVDAQSAVVRRFEVRMELPEASVLQHGALDIDYGPVSISGRSFFLPIQFEARADLGGELVKNQTQVVQYRKYGAQTTIHFDDAPAEPAP